ncbi:MAG TPA: PilZ domain-containing protein [Candidatus Baltobacteraceae bacterium]|nr:PilZ domain-containing protein [Candidatus Baltobacteraceae bacterium]
MLADLLTWFSGRPENRRRYPRRTGGFRAWFATSTGWTALIPVDISASGMGLVSPSKFEKDEVNFRIQLEERPVMLRAKQVWCIPGTLQGKPVWRYGVKYTGIAADDWDALVRFCSNESVTVENKAQKELELVRMQADDVARLIPQRLQERLLVMIVQMRRLAPIEKDKIPLVQYFYGGTVKRGAKTMHRLSIHSRLNDPATGEALEYDTRFLFDDSGNEIEVLQ